MRASGLRERDPKLLSVGPWAHRENLLSIQVQWMLDRGLAGRTRSPSEFNGCWTVALRESSLSIQAKLDGVSLFDERKQEPDHQGRAEILRDRKWGLFPES